MASNRRKASRVTIQPGQLNYQASRQALVQFENSVAFYVQGDGNLVVYDNGVPLWASLSNVGSGDESKLKLVFLESGDLVLYYDGKVQWSTKTGGTGKKLIIQDMKPYLYITDQDGKIAWYSIRGS